MDPPTANGSGLNPSPSDSLATSQTNFVDYLDGNGQYAATGTTILLSSHHLGEVDRACGVFVFLNEGRLVGVEHAERLRERAARLLHVQWPALDEARLDAALARLKGCRARRDGNRAVLELESPDPRGVLGQLATDTSLPALQTLHYGELSLRELYRDLYGVEAC